MTTLADRIRDGAKRRGLLGVTVGIIPSGGTFCWHQHAWGTETFYRIGGFCWEERCEGGKTQVRVTWRGGEWVGDPWREVEAPRG